MLTAILAFGLFVGWLFMYGACTDVPGVTLDSGFEIKVLKVSVGTKSYEPGLALPKSLARYFVPRRWKGSLGIEDPTARTLKVDLAKIDPVRAKYLPPEFRGVTLRFPDGRFAHASVTVSKSNTVHLLFPSFPRTEKTLEIQLRVADQRVTLNVPNPQPTRAESWTHAPLPQTNLIGKTAVVLREHIEDDEFQLLLHSSSLGEDKQKWMQWRLELRDPTGNWTPLDLRGRRIGRPNTPLMGESLKLVAQGTEYISAGMVSLPEPQSAGQLAPELRAVELGLRKIYLLGAGGYELDEEKSMKLIPAAKNETANKEAVLRCENNGSMAVNCPGPSLLILYEPSTVKFKARLRERQGKDRDGNVFQSRRAILATNEFGRTLVAGLFPLSIKTDEQKLEAEIMVTHPPVEFFIAANYFKANNRN